MDSTDWATARSSRSWFFSISRKHRITSELHHGVQLLSIDPLDASPSHQLACRCPGSRYGSRIFRRTAFSVAAEMEGSSLSNSRWKKW